MSEAAEITKSGSLAWRWSLRVIGCVLFVVILANVDLGKVMALLKTTTPAQILGACTLSLGILFLKAWRWHVFMAGLELRDSVQTSFAMSFNAFLWGFLTPGRLGEFKRAAYVMRRFGVPSTKAIMLCITDRLFDLAAIVIIICLSISHSSLARALGILPMDAGEVLVAGGIVAALVVAFLTIQSVRPLRTRVANLARPFFEFLGILGLGPIRLTSVILLSVVSFLAYCLAVYVLAMHLPVTFEPADLPLLVGGTMIVGVLPISIFNFGTREAVLIVMLGALGNTLEQVVAFSMLFVLAYIIQLVLSLMLSATFVRWT